MYVLNIVWRATITRYVALLLLVAAGIAIGYFAVFLTPANLLGIYPGKPKIGYIDIPFTVLTDNSAFVIREFLDYSRRNDDIKAVVIHLDSPGGFGAASEQLFQETRKLREEKPVVIVAHDFMASGAYMMSLGANFVYARSFSNVGNVGVFAGLPDLLPEIPPENLVRTGPQKFLGSTRRQAIEDIDQAKKVFAEMVFTEREGRLNISREELLQGRLYLGVEGVRLGLVDAIGGDEDAIQKAASLAGISNYELVDVNTEVFRIFNQKIWRQIEPLEPLLAGSESESPLRVMTAIMRTSGSTGDSAHPLSAVTSIDMLRGLFLTTGHKEVQESAPPGLPLEINRPRLYFLYVGNTQ